HSILRAYGERQCSRNAANCSKEIALPHGHPQDSGRDIVPTQTGMLADVAHGSLITSFLAYPRRFRFTPVSDRRADAPGTSGSANSRHPAPQQKEAYSMTSSAIDSRLGVTVRPSALAVLRLITSSNLSGACTGRSPGFSPLMMRSI